MTKEEDIKIEMEKFKQAALLFVQTITSIGRVPISSISIIPDNEERPTRISIKIEI